MSQARLSLLQIHLAVFLAGATGLFGKVVAVHPAVIVCGRTIFGSLALAVAARLTMANLRPHSRRDLLLLALSGAILALHWFTFFYSIQVSTVTIGLLGYATFPLFVTWLEPVFFRERLHRSDVVTSVVVVAGLILVTPRFDFGNHLTQGLLWGILSGFACALLSLLSRSFVRRYPGVTVAFHQQAFAALCSLPVALCWPGRITARDVGLLLVLGVFFTALLQWLVIASLRHLRAQTASVLFGLEPVYGIVLAWLLLAEKPGLRTLGGGLLICGAVLWTSVQRSRPLASPDLGAGQNPEP